MPWEFRVSEDCGLDLSPYDCPLDVWWTTDRSLPSWCGKYTTSKKNYDYNVMIIITKIIRVIIITITIINIFIIIFIIISCIYLQISFRHTCYLYIFIHQFLLAYTSPYPSPNMYQAYICLGHLYLPVPLYSPIYLYIYPSSLVK